MVPDIFEELRSLVELWVPNVSILCDEIFAVLAACPAEAFVLPGTRLHWMLFGYAPLDGAF